MAHNKLCELLGPPEEGNQQPSPESNLGKGSTTRSNVPTLREYLSDGEYDYLLELEFVPMTLNGKLFAIANSSSIPQIFWAMGVKVDFEEYERGYLKPEWLDLPLYMLQEEVEEYEGPRAQSTS